MSGYEFCWSVSETQLLSRKGAFIHARNLEVLKTLCGKEVYGFWYMGGSDIHDIDCESCKSVIENE